jgi:hypothetical protein
VGYFFDEVTDYLTVTDSAVLDLPNSDWSIAGWVKLTDNDGAGFQYFYSHGTVDNANTLNFFVDEGNDNLLVSIRDAGGDAWAGAAVAGRLTAAGFGASTDWQHIILRRLTNTCSLFVNNVLAEEENDNTVGAIQPASNLILGGRLDLNSERFLGGYMAEWAKWDSALLAADRAALVAGYSPQLVKPQSLVWHLPLLRGLQDRTDSLSVAATNAVPASEHPRAIYPQRGNRSPLLAFDDGNGGAPIFGGGIIGSAGTIFNGMIVR